MTASGARRVRAAIYNETLHRQIDLADKQTVARTFREHAAHLCRGLEDFRLIGAMYLQQLTE